MTEDKKETVFERLHKLGTMNTTNVLTNMMLNIARDSEDEYGCLDRVFVTEELYHFLNAPADNYYFCSAQEANIGDEE